MRKGLVYGAVIVSCAAWFGVVDATYVIKLKNGNEYLTTRYWHDGSQVLFDTYGGIFGIDKAFVSKIEQSNRALPLSIQTSMQEKPTAAQQQPSGSSAQPESKNQGDGTDLKPTKAAPAPAPKEPLKKDEEVMKEYNELQKRFGQLNDLPTHEVHSLDADIDSLRKRVLSSELAEAHKEEMDALATLQRAINGYLKVANP
jgi:hypothetical protein